VSTNIFDRIETITGDSYSGVIDYVTAKYVSFFDVTNNNDPQITKILIIYKMHFTHLRFSVFKAMYFPLYEMRPIVINRRTITKSSREIETTEIRKRSFKITKRQPQ
jgi:hypothetical protein